MLTFCFKNIVFYFYIDMILNKTKLLLVFKKINTISLFRKREWDKIYNKMSVFDINYELWCNILKDCNIKDYKINIDEFYNYAKIFFSYDETLKLFAKINLKSNYISFEDFNYFLEKISEEQYLVLINSLEPEKNQEENNNIINNKNL